MQQCTTGEKEVVTRSLLYRLCSILYSVRAMSPLLLLVALITFNNMSNAPPLVLPVCYQIASVEMLGGEVADLAQHPVLYSEYPHRIV